MRRRVLLPALGVVALVALSFGLGQSGRAPVAAPAAPEQDGGYGYVANGVALLQTDEQGRRQYALNATQVRQLATADPVDVSRLELQYAPPGSPDPGTRPEAGWTLRADAAQLPREGGLLQLRGNVNASGSPDGRGPPLVLRTESLDYDTQSQRVSTREPVLLTWERSQVSGVGLEADLKSGTVELPSQVHGRYAP